MKRPSGITSGAFAVTSLLVLLASVVFSWASNRSAGWSIAFGSALVLGTAAVLLVAVEHKRFRAFRSRRNFSANTNRKK
jgi:hypothetical protein